MMFAVRWPDGAERAYYSPSLVVADHLEAGASDRVRAKYGFPCSRAAGSLSGIERDAAGFAGGSVTVTGFRY